MKFISLNAGGLNNIAKLHSVINTVRQYDVALIQETKLLMRSLGQIQLKWRNPEGVFMSVAPNGARRGVLTLFSPRLSVNHIHSHADTEGQFMINICRIDEVTYLIANIYGDPDTDNRAADTMDRLNHTIDDIKLRFNITHEIAAGDFNLALHDHDRRTTTRKPRAEGKLSTIITTNLWFDSALMCHDRPRHTYFRYRMETTSAR